MAYNSAVIGKPAMQSAKYTLARASDRSKYTFYGCVFEFVKIGF